jgi:hypothetical protein
METRAMSDEEAREEIRKMGGYATWRRQAFGDQPLRTPEPVRKNAQQLLLENIESIAKSRRISLEQYFRENPEDYRILQELGTSRKRG